MKAHRPCNLCGSLEVTMCYKPLGIVRCAACGFVFRDTVSVDTNYDSLERYRQNLQDPQRLDSRRRNAVNRLALIKDAVGLEGNLLDIGSNEGMFLEEARKLGLKGIGCEPNNSAAEYARQKGIEVINAAFEAALEEISKRGPFRMFTMFHVLEHLFDPLKALREVCNMMQEDSYVVIEVPDLNSPASRVYGWEDPRISKEHLSYFTVTTLTQLLSKAGFETIMKRRNSFDLYRQPFLYHFIRLPFIMQLYSAARSLKRMGKRFLGFPPRARVTYNDSRELWDTTVFFENPRNVISQIMGQITNLLGRGDEIFIIAKKNAS